jgi:hypothetical protein
LLRKYVFSTDHVVMLASFFVPGGAANSSWTAYPPLVVYATEGQTWWLAGMLCSSVLSLLGAINLIYHRRATTCAGADLVPARDRADDERDARLYYAMAGWHALHLVAGVLVVA